MKWTKEFPAGVTSGWFWIRDPGDPAAAWIARMSFADPNDAILRKPRECVLCYWDERDGSWFRFPQGAELAGPIPEPGSTTAHVGHHMAVYGGSGEIIGRLVPTEHGDYVREPLSLAEMDEIRRQRKDA